MFLCFLPLSHSYEHTAGMMFPISIGAEIYFAEGAETLAANMLEARPTIMTAVPRLYETCISASCAAWSAQSGLKPPRSSTWRCALGRKRFDDRTASRSLERLLDLVARARWCGARCARASAAG